MFNMRSFGVLVADALSIFVVVLLIDNILSKTSPADFAFVVPQGTGFVSKQVLVTPNSLLEDKQLAMGLVTRAPGGSLPALMHPGDCYGIVVDGVVELRVEGKASCRLSTGDSSNALANLVDQFVNVGKMPAYLVNTPALQNGK